jgi:hypothetical protein
MAGLSRTPGVKTTDGVIAVGRLAKSLGHAFRVDLEGAVHAAALCPSSPFARDDKDTWSSIVYPALQGVMQRVSQQKDA